MKQENTIFLRAFISQEFSKKQITIINIISVVVASLVLWVKYSNLTLFQGCQQKQAIPIVTCKNLKPINQFSNQKPLR